MILSTRFHDIIAISILLGTLKGGSSWILQRHSDLPHTWHFRRSLGVISSRPGIFFEDESDCPDEEECEIDWSAMPGFGDDDDDDDKTKEDVPDKEEGQKTAASVVREGEEYHLIGDEMDELEPREVYVRKVERSVEKSRTIFEMNWQIENCEVDENSCSDFCSECAGSGKSRCLFCRGTKMIAFQDEFRPCLICSEKGQVDCSACSGTGSISPWAKTHDGNEFRRLLE